MADEKGKEPADDEEKGRRKKKKGGSTCKATKDFRKRLGLPECEEHEPRGNDE